MRRGAFLVLAAAATVLLVAVPAQASAGDGWSLLDLLSGIGKFFTSLLDGIIDGLKYLFIPHEDYFPSVQQKLNTAFSAKFGGVKGVFTYLGARFGGLTRYKATDTMFIMQFPQNNILSNARINLLQNAEGLITMIRGAITGFVTLSTVAFIWHKVKEFINT